MVVDVEPSPNVHAHDVGELVDASVNTTVRGAVPDVGVPVKLATGAATGVAVFTVYAFRQIFAFGILVVRSVQVEPVELM